MHAHATPPKKQQHRQIPQRQRLGLEDALEPRDVDEGELDEERDGDGEEEHLVGCAGEEGDVETAVLESGGEVEKDEGGEGL